MRSAPKRWWWADVDGTLHRVRRLDLHQILEDGALPPFVLVWRPGYAEWLPAYLVEEFASALGSQEMVLAAPPFAPEQTTPPAPPLEWYVECLGDTAAERSLIEDRDSMPQSVLNLDWRDFGESWFPESETPTLRSSRRSLPAAAFPHADAYLSHIQLTARSRRR